MMRERHNLILCCLAKAIPRHIGDYCFLEQKIPGSPPGDLRPDIYITNQDSGEAIIVDVTTPFETGPEAFDKARSEKIDKYTPLVDWLKSQDQVSCVFSPCIYSWFSWSLGSTK